MSVLTGNVIYQSDQDFLSSCHTLSKILLCVTVPNDNQQLSHWFLPNRTAKAKLCVLINTLLTDCLYCSIHIHLGGINKFCFVLSWFDYTKDQTWSCRNPHRGTLAMWITLPVLRFTTIRELSPKFSWNLPVSKLQMVRYRSTQVHVTSKTDPTSCTITEKRNFSDLYCALLLRLTPCQYLKVSDILANRCFLKLWSQVYPFVSISCKPSVT